MRWACRCDRTVGWFARSVPRTGSARRSSRNPRDDLVHPRIGIQLGNVEFAFQPMEGIIADLLAVAQILQRVALAPEDLEPARGILGCRLRFARSRGRAGVESHTVQNAARELYLPIDHVVVAKWEREYQRLQGQT